MVVLKQKELKLKPIQLILDVITPKARVAWAENQMETSF
jgi:hypothetical protein